MQHNNKQQISGYVNGFANGTKQLCTNVKNINNDKKKKNDDDDNNDE